MALFRALGAGDATEARARSRWSRVLPWAAIVFLVANAALLAFLWIRDDDSGSMRVEVSDLPSGASPDIEVRGPDGFETVVHGGEIEGLAPGHYELIAQPVAADDATFFADVVEREVDIDSHETETVQFSYFTKMPDTTKVLSPEVLGGLSAVSLERSRIVFSRLDVDIAEGDVIVAGVSPRTPQGLLRKVSSVDEEDDRTVLVTQPASLAEAVERGRFSLSRELVFDDVRRATPLVKGAEFEDGSLVVTIEGKAGKGLGIPCEDGVEARLEGRLELDPDFDFSASWGLFSGLEASASLTVDEEAEVTLSATGEAKCSKEVELYRLHFNPITVPVGPVPVVLTPVLTVNAGVKGEVSAGLSMAAVQDASFTAGLLYDDGDIEKIQRSETDFGAPHLDVQPVELEARASAGPQLDVLVYGVVGPSVEANGYLRGTVDPFERPWWELFGGLEASARISLDVLGGRIKVKLAEAKIFELETSLLSSKGDPPAVPVTKEDLLDLRLPNSACRGAVPSDVSRQLEDGKTEQGPFGEGIAEVITVVGKLDSDNAPDGVLVVGCSSGGTFFPFGVYARLSSSPRVIEVPYGRGIETSYEFDVYDATISERALELKIGASQEWDAHCCSTRDVVEVLTVEDDDFVRKSVTIVDAPGLTVELAEAVNDGDTVRLGELASPRVVRKLLALRDDYGPLDEDRSVCYQTPGGPDTGCLVEAGGWTAEVTWSRSDFAVWRAVDYVDIGGGA